MCESQISWARDPSPQGTTTALSHVTGCPSRGGPSPQRVQADGPRIPRAATTATFCQSSYDVSAHLLPQALLPQPHSVRRAGGTRAHHTPGQARPLTRTCRPPHLPADRHLALHAWVPPTPIPLAYSLHLQNTPKSVSLTASCPSTALPTTWRPRGSEADTSPLRIALSLKAKSPTRCLVPSGLVLAALCCTCGGRPRPALVSRLCLTLAPGLALPTQGACPLLTAPQPSHLNQPLPHGCSQPLPCFVFI